MAAAAAGPGPGTRAMAWRAAAARGDPRATLAAKAERGEDPPPTAEEAAAATAAAAAAAAAAEVLFSGSDAAAPAAEAMAMRDRGDKRWPLPTGDDDDDDDGLTAEVGDADDGRLVWKRAARGAWVKTEGGHCGSGCGSGRW